MALHDDTARLYQVPLAAFISARQALVAELKRAGRAADAAVVKGLAKPSRGAWAVNQVFWHARDAFDAVVAAGERLRAAQHARLGGDTGASVVGAVEARDLAIEAAIRAADVHARDLGDRIPPDLRQRVRLTFEAIAARPIAELTAAPGWLHEDLGPSGFGAMAALVPGGGLGALPSWDAMAVGEPGEAGAKPSSRPALRLVEPPARIAAARAAARRQAREAELAAARAEAARAAQAAVAAQAATEAAQRAVVAARAALAARERQLVEAQRAHDAATRDLTRAEAEAATAAQVARQALTRRGAADLQVAERLDDLASKADG